MSDDLKDDDLGLGLNDDISDDLGLGLGTDLWPETGQSPIDKHSSLLKDLTDFDPIIQQRIRNWLGLDWDKDSKSFKPKLPAIINEKGARWAIGFLRTYQCKTNIITNISKHEFGNLQLDVIKIAWVVFPTNDDFGVKSNADWYRLCTELDNSAFLILAGAADGKYTKFLQESVSRTETVNLSPTQPQSRQTKAGLFARIKNGILGRG